MYEIRNFDIEGNVFSSKKIDPNADLDVRVGYCFPLYLNDNTILGFSEKKNLKSYEPVVGMWPDDMEKMEEIFQGINAQRPYFKRLLTVNVVPTKIYLQDDKFVKIQFQ